MYKMTILYCRLNQIVFLSVFLLLLVGKNVVNGQKLRKLDASDKYKNGNEERKNANFNTEDNAIEENIDVHSKNSFFNKVSRHNFLESRSCGTLDSNVEQSFQIMMIADLDKQSLDKSDPKGKLKFKSYIMKGSVTEIPGSDGNTASFAATLQQPEIQVESQLNEGGRGVELSDLVYFNDKLLTFDDRTGAVFEVIRRGVENSPVVLRPFLVLADINDNMKMAKGMKIEWATKKGNKLYVGSYGNEFVGENNKILHKNMMLVRTINQNWKVETIDWEANFKKIKEKLGCPFPGYVFHEAVNWAPCLQRWVFLPRKVSTESFDDKGQETKGSLKMVIATDDFSDIRIVDIKLTDASNTKGFSSFKFVPNTHNRVIIALRSVEVGDSQSTSLVMFTIDGQELVKDIVVSPIYKYEGIEFV